MWTKHFTPLTRLKYLKVEMTKSNTQHQNMSKTRHQNGTKKISTLLPKYC